MSKYNIRQLSRFVNKKSNYLSNKFMDFNLLILLKKYNLCVGYLQVRSKKTGKY
jgi:hypothetical protein